MIIPWKMIDKDTLNNLIEEFVSREGTDNGYDQSLDDRVKQVIKKLRAEDVVVTFDSATESVNIIPKDNVIDDNA